MTARKQVTKQASQERRAVVRGSALTALTLLGLLAGIAFAVFDLPLWMSAAAYLLAYLAGGVPAGWQALKSLLAGKLDIDLLMVTAAIAAAAVGEPRDGAILLFLFSLANTLEDYAMGRTKRAVEAIMELRPETANRRKRASDGMAQDDAVEPVSIDDLTVGDIVVVRPGERVPVDGNVIKGRTVMDQSAITGESLPVDKATGDPVFAATVNGYGVIEVEVTKLAGETTLARMIELVTEAQQQRSPTQRFSEWFGERYTVFVLVGSAVGYVVFTLLGMPANDALYRAATLLVAASPCAVVISVPAAVLSALAAAARGGVLFKGGGALEDFGNIEALAFDKTGTLTIGKPEVTDVVPFRLDRQRLLAIAAGIEVHSEHPIAQSIVAFAGEQGVAPSGSEEAEAIPGQGMAARIGGGSYWAGNRTMARRFEAGLEPEVESKLRAIEQSGKTAILIGNERHVLGVVAVADTPRSSARDALDRLRAAGLRRTVMLTGDHAQAAALIGRELGFDPKDVHAELLPEDKVRIIREMRQHTRLAFVGDGINDAAALVSADVGVAMGTAGSDVAIEAADVALLSDDLTRLEHAHALARRANRIVKQNFTFAVSSMAILVLLTLFAALPLPLAVVGHEGGTLVVVFNGLRLLFFRRHGKSAGALADAAGAPPKHEQAPL